MRYCCFFILREKSRKGGDVTIHIATWSLRIWWNFGWQLLLEGLQALAKLKADPVFNGELFDCLPERRSCCVLYCVFERIVFLLREEEFRYFSDI